MKSDSSDKEQAMNAVERQKLHMILRDIINTLNTIQVKYHLELEQTNKKIDVIMFVLRHIAKSEEVDRLILKAKEQLNEPNLGDSFSTTLDKEIQKLEQWVNEVIVLERMLEDEPGTRPHGGSDTPLQFDPEEESPS